MTREAEPDPAESLAQANVRARADVSGGRLAGIAVLESGPVNIKLHRIEDHELEMMMNISRPMSLAISSATLGAWLGLLPSVFVILSSVEQAKPVSLFDIRIVVIFAICLAVCAVTGISAVQGIRKANRLLSAIRSRPLSPL